MKFKNLIIRLFFFGFLGCSSTSQNLSDNSLSDIATHYDLTYALTKEQPNQTAPFLIEILQKFSTPAGSPKALDIGSGMGRNALFAARKGYQVTAVDIARIGLNQIQNSAAANHLSITTVLQDINHFNFGKQRWDLIMLIDFPFPYQTLLPKIIEGLKPHGIIVLEEVSNKEPVRRSEPLNFTRMDITDISKNFRGFSVIHESENLYPTPWGQQAIMIRYAAMKP